MRGDEGLSLPHFARASIYHIQDPGSDYTGQNGSGAEEQRQGLEQTLPLDLITMAGPWTPSQPPLGEEPKIPYQQCPRMLQTQARAERAPNPARGPFALQELGPGLGLLFTEHRSDSHLHLISARGCFPGTDAFA